MCIRDRSTDLIKYYLNEATNLIQSNPNFKYMITVNGKAWKFIKVNSEVMQHFLLVLYYAQAMLAFKFRSEDIGQLTHLIRTSYPEIEKVLGIGYSYSDLKFLGESDVSISTCQDLPTDIKVDSLNKISETLKLGSHLSKVKLSRSSLVFYRIIVLATVVFIY